MPCDECGNPKRCYTNQSEIENNKLTRQKEAVKKSDKNKSNMSKTEFVRDVSEQVDPQAVFGMREELAN